jgi:hypothetical protein
MQKIFLIKFAYNNNMHNMININSFFVIYDFHSNVFFTVKNDYLEKKMLITREIAEKFKSESKKLTKR